MLKIGNRQLSIPLIQGGMGIGVSRSRLAGAVAAQGGMGVISSAQVGYDKENFEKNPRECNRQALAEHIQKAKEAAEGKGLIGVNIMTAINDYEEAVQVCCEAGADAIISGAGLPTMLPGLVKGYDILIAPIVSSVKSMQTILRYWDKKYNRTADFLVIEGPLAGGHLGFSYDTLQSLPDYDYDAEVKGILEAKKAYEEKYGHTIPAFLGGGIHDVTTAAHAFSLGVDGIQVATRFVATAECDASDRYKQAYINAKPSDITIIKSPVGMPGRAVRNSFVNRMEQEPEQIRFCYRCLKACNPKTAPYCITKALIQAVQGDVDNGLVFCGAEVGRLQEITTAAQVIEELSPAWK